MITLTEKAQEKIKEIADGDAIGHYCIRIKLIGGGCSGYQHDLMFDNQISNIDEITEIGDIKVVADQLTYQYVQNVEISFVENGFESGFKFGSVDIKNSCGCGKSVSY